MADPTAIDLAPARDPQTSLDEVARRADALVTNVGHAIQGKAEVVRQVVIALLAGGHVLLEDVPGVGKTTLAKALAASVHGTVGRIQFTPDLLPSDVVGVSVFDRSSATFSFQPGPVFSTVVLADEINRAAPKTQSALLEAMAEGQVTVSGTTYDLGEPFLVLATQNPAEHEGAYPLPDSQLDRFLLRTSMGYPSADDELAILREDGAVAALAALRPVIDEREVAALARAVRTVRVAPALQAYLVELARATRRHPGIAQGMSPRATLGLQRAAQARAAISGRPYVTPDDVKELAGPVVAHRLLLTTEAALARTSRADVVARVLAEVPVPSARR